MLAVKQSVDERASKIAQGPYLMVVCTPVYARLQMQ